MNIIFKEYEQIYQQFVDRTGDINTFDYNSTNAKFFEIEKTGCRKNLFDHNITVSKDTFLIILSPLTCKFGLLDETFFEIKGTT